MTVVFLLLTAAGCSAKTSEQPKPETITSKVVVGEPDELLPADSTEDWRIFADHIALVHIVDESEVSPTEDELTAGEGFIGRTLTFRVDKVLWSRDGADAAPSELKLNLDGWTFKGDEKTPLRFEGEPMLIPGNSYLMPIVHMTVGRLVDEPYWSDLSVTAILPVQDGVVGRGDSIVGGDDALSPVQRQLWGRAIAQAAQLMRSTTVPKEAQPFMSLPPTDRLSAMTK